jgi:predicted GNAT family N-acyltransferase
MLLIGNPETPEQFDEYFELRWRVVRAPWNQPRGSERDELDASADHVSVYDVNKRLIGVGRLHLNNATEAQIRYMASEEAFRGLGVGRSIVEKLELLARSYGVERIVLNSRERAVGFYKHLRYHIVNDGPTMFDEIQHFKMEKIFRNDMEADG